MCDPWNLGGLNPSFFVIWGGLAPPSPYVEPPLSKCIHFDSYTQLSPRANPLEIVPELTMDYPLDNRNCKLEISIAPTKRSHRNQFIHKRFSKTKSIGSGSDPGNLAGRLQS